MSHSPLFRLLPVFAFTSVITLLPACAQEQAAVNGDNPAAATAAVPATRAKPGTVQGRATDTAGNPLGGVEIAIYGTTMAGENTRFELTTRADGTYRQRVPDGIYGVRAEYVFHAPDGQNYTVTLHPVDGVTGKRHDAEEGIAKDFVWKISGLRPDQTPGTPGTHNEPGKYYGGALQTSFLERGFGGVKIPEGSTLVLTLEPQGTLLDGRPAQTLTFRRTFGPEAHASSYFYPSDIPLGHYTLSARLESPDGEGRDLRLKRSLDNQGDYAPSTTVDVVPDSSSGASLPIQIMIDPEAAP